MIQGRRTIFSILIGATLNTLLVLTVLPGPSYCFAVECLRAPQLKEFLAVMTFSMPFTAIGVVLLLFVTSLAIPNLISGIAAKIFFVLVGAVIGFFVFGLIMNGGFLLAMFGAIAASSFALVCPKWFEPSNKATLAEP